MVKIFHASVNPSYYDLVEIGKMSYDDAVKFFENDTIHCCNVYEREVDTLKPNEFKFSCDGADGGDGSDTMFVWVKVTENVDKVYDGIVNKMADYIMEDYVDETSFPYATDLAECDYIDIQNFVVLDYNNTTPYDDADDIKPFSIKDFNKKKKFYLLDVQSFFEGLVKENWEEWLTDEEVEYIYDNRDIACIKDKYLYGGGGFEYMADFGIDVAKKIAERIKSKYIK